MAKQEAEQSNSLSIFWLKKHGYLKKDFSYKSGGIKWTYGFSGNESSIGFSVVRDNWGTPEESAYIKLQYTHTSHWSGEKESMDYKVNLTTTPCRYGGKRYWFICPLTKNGKYCGRRIGVLFSIGKWFGCRHCGDIAYATQMQSGKFRWNGISANDLDKMQADIKRYQYKGKLTRKYKRFLELSDKFENDFILMAERLGGRLNRHKKI